MGICDQPTLQVLPRDALTAPTVDDLQAMSLMLIPRGAAWGSSDDEAPPLTGVRAMLFKGFAVGLKAAYDRLTEVLQASGVTSQYIATDEWENEIGLPDACLTPPEDDEARRQAIIERRRWRGIMTPADFACLVDNLGYSARIEDHFDGMRVGSPIGNLRLGRSSDECVVTFVVELVSPPTHFAIGTDGIGNVRLTDYRSADDLACYLDRVMPADILPVINYVA
ncbi:putative bacteriophage related protein [uncultured Pleomorphomonas sp.]|uniref:Putative bacteriophage related protein n=1 Tax=uncultured Pleomorphomonas sp. TaxID=442121 RepID=A0A212L6Z0_9HYPH|nr:hypothetical protein [uncultured Pleomorphomonas sp.]SCM73342.1 putative bacteriophage related protein [uncultured Pleomorphomonas sp.]